MGKVLLEIAQSIEMNQTRPNLTLANISHAIAIVKLPKGAFMTSTLSPSFLLSRDISIRKYYVITSSVIDLN